MPKTSVKTYSAAWLTTMPTIPTRPNFEGEASARKMRRTLGRRYRRRERLGWRSADKRPSWLGEEGRECARGGGGMIWLVRGVRQTCRGAHGRSRCRQGTDGDGAPDAAGV